MEQGYTIAGAKQMKTYVSCLEANFSSFVLNLNQELSIMISFGRLKFANDRKRDFKINFKKKDKKSVDITDFIHSYFYYK